MKVRRQLRTPAVGFPQVSDFPVDQHPLPTGQHPRSTRLDRSSSASALASPSDFTTSCDFAGIVGPEVRAGSGSRKARAATVPADLFSHRSRGKRAAALVREDPLARSAPTCPPVDTRLPLFFAFFVSKCLGSVRPRGR